MIVLTKIWANRIQPDIYRCVIDINADEVKELVAALKYITYKDCDNVHFTHYTPDDTIIHNLVTQFEIVAEME